MSQDIKSVATYKKNALLSNFSQKIQVALDCRSPTLSDLPEWPDLDYDVPSPLVQCPDH